jgi:hypothetical protein
LWVEKSSTPASTSSSLEFEEVKPSVKQDEILLSKQKEGEFEGDISTPIRIKA